MGDQIDAYPPLSIHLDGVTLDVGSRDYLLLGSPLATSPGEFCLGIRDGGSVASGGFVIGDTIMRNYYVVHDNVRHLICWGRVNRKTCGSIRDSGAIAESSVLERL